jgi:hypothetical protein
MCIGFGKIRDGDQPEVYPFRLLFELTSIPFASFCDIALNKLMMQLLQVLLPCLAEALVLLPVPLQQHVRLLLLNSK